MASKTFKPKPVDEQVIVITGASSGIGMTTAKLAAKRGAKVMLVSRNGDALGKLAADIREDGGDADHAVADVAQEADLRRAAQQCITRFGGFDTWVNNAGVSVYGKIEDVTMEDHRRLFETNFWGLVHGSRIACERLREHGGVLINIGSTLSDRAIPLQGMYSASKHAVRGFTDALRMELEKDEAPVPVVLIKPGSIDTMYTEHAKNYLDEEPQNPQPVYHPQIVAKVILHCAQYPRRDAFVGSGGKGISFLETISPRAADHVMEWTFFDQQHSGEPTYPGRDDALYHPTTAGRERSGKNRFVRKHSLYTTGELHPVMTLGVTAAALATVGVVGYMLSTGKRLSVDSAMSMLGRGGDQRADPLTGEEGMVCPPAGIDRPHAHGTE